MGGFLGGFVGGFINQVKIECSIVRTDAGLDIK